MAVCGLFVGVGIHSLPDFLLSLLNLLRARWSLVVGAQDDIGLASGVGVDGSGFRSGAGSGAVFQLA